MLRHLSGGLGERSLAGNEVVPDHRSRLQGLRMAQPVGQRGGALQSPQCRDAGLIDRQTADSTSWDTLQSCLWLGRRDGLTDVKHERRQRQA
ncbi:MAG: hypothetical protein ACFB0G_15930 [Leptolyngbyaceae cyanobacterium]